MRGYAEALGLRRAAESNDRQVLPTPIMAHIKANASATVWPARLAHAERRMANYAAISRVVRIETAHRPATDHDRPHETS